jgi:hypothetical protein
LLSMKTEPPGLSCFVFMSVIRPYPVRDKPTE